MCHRSTLFSLSVNIGHWNDFSVQRFAFLKRRPSHFWLKLELHTWAQLSSRSSALTFDPELFVDISANSSSPDCKRRSDICFSSPHRTDQKNRKSPGAIRRIRHFCLSVSVVSPSRFAQIVHRERLWTSLGCSNVIIQLSFYPQAMNNLWIVNQRRGVSSLDWSAALMGPQGLRWRETKPAPFHPLLVQIKIKVVLKGPACAQVIWGPLEKNPGENTSLIPIHVLTDKTNQKCLPVSSTPSQS